MYTFIKRFFACGLLAVLFLSGGVEAASLGFAEGYAGSSFADQKHGHMDGEDQLSRVDDSSEVGELDTGLDRGDDNAKAVTEYYTGLGVGYDSSSTYVDLHNTTGGANTRDMTSRAAGRGFSETVTLGVYPSGLRTGNWRFGLEALGEYSHLSGKQNNPGTRANLDPQLKYTFGALALLKYKTSSTSSYLVKLGPVWSGWSFQTSRTAFGRRSNKKTVVGYRLLLGTELALVDKWVVNIGTSYTLYNSANVKHVDSGASYKFYLQPSLFSFRLGFVRYF